MLLPWGKMEENYSQIKDKRRGIKESQAVWKSAVPKTASSGVQASISLCLCLTVVTILSIAYIQHRHNTDICTNIDVNLYRHICIYKHIHIHMYWTVDYKSISQTFTHPVNWQICELYKVPATIPGSRNISVNKKDEISALVEFPLILMVLGYSVRSWYHMWLSYSPVWIPSSCFS